jgi:hypothetical protein
VRFSRPCDYGLARTQFAIFTTDMKHSPASKNEVDLVGLRMAVNPLILSGFQAV